MSLSISQLCKLWRPTLIFSFRGEIAQSWLRVEFANDAKCALMLSSKRGVCTIIITLLRFLLCVREFCAMLNMFLLDSIACNSRVSVLLLASLDVFRLVMSTVGADNTRMSYSYLPGFFRF